MTAVINGIQYIGHTMLRWTNDSTQHTFIHGGFASLLAMMPKHDQWQNQQQEADKFNTMTGEKPHQWWVNSEW